MRLTLSFNDAEFSALLRNVARRSASKTFPDSCNAKGLHLASAAIRHTRKADAAKIEHELGRVATRVPGRGWKGKIRARHKIYTENPDSLAYRIVRRRLLDRGESFTDAELQQKVKAMRNARLRSVAFIRSGWIYAARILAGIVGYESRAHKYTKSDTARMSGLPKGFVRPATPRASGIIECVIGNSALLRDAHGNPMPVAQEGLNAAFAEVKADMLQHLENKMWKTFQDAR